MSLGQQLIHAIIVSQSRHAIRELNPGLFLGDELPLYEHLMNVYRRHGTIPTQITLQEQGFQDVLANEPVSYYLERVRNRAIANVLMAHHPAFIRAMGRGESEAALAAIDRMRQESRLFRTNQDTFSLADAGEMVRDDYQLTSNSSAMRGITTGWRFLDEKTSGFCDGDIGVVVGRIGLGKSYTMLNMALAAWRAGHSVLFVTMEMTVLQTARRFLSMHAGLNPSVVRRGQLDSWSQTVLFEAFASAQTGPPFYISSGSMKKTVGNIDALIQELTPDIIYVDAAYLVDPTTSSSRSSRHELLQEVLREFKLTALSRNRPLILSVQFNRAGAKDGSMENISGTDWIGQIASTVLSIHEGPSGYEKTQRHYKILKSRDEETGAEFLTHYRFQPFNMEFISQCQSDGRPFVDGTAPMEAIS